MSCKLLITQNPELWHVCERLGVCLGGGGERRLREVTNLSFLVFSSAQVNCYISDIILIPQGCA